MRKLPRLSLTQLLILGAALVISYLAFTAAEEFLLSHRLNREEQSLQREISDLRRQQAELEAIRDYLRTDEYVEGVARRVLGLVRPGETLIVVSSSVPPTPTQEQSLDGDTPRWWEQLYGR